MHSPTRAALPVALLMFAILPGCGPDDPVEPRAAQQIPQPPSADAGSDAGEPPDAEPPDAASEMDAGVPDADTGDAGEDAGPTEDAGPQVPLGWTAGLVASAAGSEPEACPASTSEIYAGVLGAAADPASCGCSCDVSAATCTQTGGPESAFNFIYDWDGSLPPPPPPPPVADPASIAQFAGWAGPPAWDSACTDISVAFVPDPDPYADGGPIQFVIFQGVSFTPPSVTVIEQSPMIAAPVVEGVRACSMTDSQVAPPGFDVCILRNGDHACPSPFANKRVSFDLIDDTRACSACDCAFAPGEKVPTECRIDFDVFAYPGCVGDAAHPDSPEAWGYLYSSDPAYSAYITVGYVGIGSIKRSLLSPTYYTGPLGVGFLASASPSAQATGGEPVGAVEPVGAAVTICCMP